MINIAGKINLGQEDKSHDLGNKINDFICWVHMMGVSGTDLVSVVSDFANLMDWVHQASLSHQGNSKNTGVGGHSLLLQGTFLTQGSNLGLPALQADSLPSEAPGKPTI